MVDGMSRRNAEVREERDDVVLELSDDISAVWISRLDG